jgi:hypothetical protein
MVYNDVHIIAANIQRVFMRDRSCKGDSVQMVGTAVGAVIDPG